MSKKEKQKREDDRAFWDFLGEVKDETSKWPERIRDSAKYLFDEDAKNSSNLEKNKRQIKLRISGKALNCDDEND